MRMSSPCVVKVRARGLSGKWSRWMPRGTCREARTRGAPILRYIGATEDAGSRCVTPGRRPEPFSGRAPSLVEIDVQNRGRRQEEEERDVLDQSRLARLW